MSRIVWGGIHHPEHWRREVIRRISSNLEHMVDLLKETGAFKLELVVLADGRAELRLSNAHGHTVAHDRADAHPEVKQEFDHERLFG